MRWRVALIGLCLSAPTFAPPARALVFPTFGLWSSTDRTQTGSGARAAVAPDGSLLVVWSDGGVPGSCTFHVRVCAKNTTLVGCTPEARLASWTLVKPSAQTAAHDAAAANVRAAFAGVAGALVGPTEEDLCTDDLAVSVPLRGLPGKHRPGKLQLKSAAAGYSGLVDTDKLRLTCLPR
jgi:hypothetical protein